MNKKDNIVWVCEKDFRGEDTKEVAKGKRF